MNSPVQLPADEVNAPERPERLPALTSLRFFLALWVMLLHGAEYLEVWCGTGPSPIMNLVRTGYQGVSVFFVLSGFILAYNYFSLTSSRSDLANFWQARFARIYPVYVFAALCYLPIGWYKDRAGTPSSLAVALSLMQSWLPDFVLRWNPPGWSVSDEVFFYATFPLWLWGLRRLNLRSIGKLGVVIFVCWCLTLVAPIWSLIQQTPGLADASSAERSQETLTHAAAIVRFNPLVRLPEFLMGVAAGIFFVTQRSTGRYDKQSLAKYGSRLALAAALVIAVMSMFATPYVPFSLLHNGLTAPLGLLLIMGLACVNRGWCTAPWLVRLGDASYAMYLLHWPIRSILRFCEQKIFDPSDFEFFSGGMLLLYLVLNVVVGLVVFNWLEEPLRRWMRRKPFEERKAASRF